MGERVQLNAAENAAARVGIAIGPQYGTVSPKFIKDAAWEASRAGDIDLLGVLGFAFDAQARLDIIIAHALDAVSTRPGHGVAAGAFLLCPHSPGCCPCRRQGRSRDGRAIQSSDTPARSELGVALGRNAVAYQSGRLRRVGDVVEFDVVADIVADAEPAPAQVDQVEKATDAHRRDSFRFRPEMPHGAVDLTRPDDDTGTHLCAAATGELGAAARTIEGRGELQRRIVDQVQSAAWQRHRFKRRKRAFCREAELRPWRRPSAAS